MAPSENWKKSGFLFCSFATNMVAQLHLCERPPTRSLTMSQPPNLQLWGRFKPGFLLCRKKLKIPGTLDCNHGLVPSISAEVSRAPKFPVLKLSPMLRSLTCSALYLMDSPHRKGARRLGDSPPKKK